MNEWAEWDKEEYPLITRWMIRRDMPEVLRIEQLNGQHWGEEDFIDNLRQRNCIGMVLESQENVVGFVVYSLFKTHLTILKLLVHPEWDQARCFTSILNRMKEKVGKHSHREHLDMVLFPDDFESMAMFSKNGFNCVREADGVMVAKFVGESSCPAE